MNSSWQYIPFSSIFEWSDKSSIKSGDGKNTGPYKMFVCSDTEIKRYDSYLSGRESLVFGTGGKASCHYVNEPFAYSTDCAVAYSDSDNAFLKFYYYYFRQAQLGLLQETFTGSGLQHTSKKKIDNILVPVVDRFEQERIVARIEEMFSEVDAGVEALKKTKAQLAVYRQAVLKEAYSTLSVSNKITDFFEITGGLTKNSSRNEYPIKRPYLRVANVYYNQLDLQEIKDIGVKESEIAEKTLVKDDLLFVEGNGSKEQIGRVAIWDGSIEGCLHQNHIIKGRPNGKMLPQYALYYLISTVGRRQIVDVASSTSGLYTLSTGKIGNLMIPYCEIEKQKVIVKKIEERLSVCDSIEQTVDTILQQAKSMKQCILKKAFEGRL